MNGISVRQHDGKVMSQKINTAAVPCYIGQAPIWQVDRTDWQDLAGTTIVATSIEDVREKIGYVLTSGWKRYNSLSMVITYHSKIEGSLPVIMIVNKAAIEVGEANTKELVFVKNYAVIEGFDVVLSSVALEGKEKGTDYNVSYSDDGNKVIVEALSDIDRCQCTYTCVNVDSIDFESDTFEEVNYIPQNTGLIPSTISVPLWDEATTGFGTVRDAMIKIAENPIDKHYYVQAVCNLEADTRDKAIEDAEKARSHKVRYCWPYASVMGRIYPVSLIFSAKKQTVDCRNAGIPFESASNEEVSIERLCTADGSTVRQLEEEADKLNKNGISTLAFVTGMKWKTWGTCMSNYVEGVSIAPNKMNDVAVQMMDFVSNDFQERYGDRIHKPLSIRAVNDIAVSYNAVLRSYVARGILVAGEITFEQSANSTAQIAAGQFVYNINETNTPPATAVIADVTYDSDALSSYLGGGEDEGN